jgi:hypothetical protein
VVGTDQRGRSGTSNQGQDRSEYQGQPAGIYNAVVEANRERARPGAQFALGGGSVFMNEGRVAGVAEISQAADQVDKVMGEGLLLFLPRDTRQC